MLLIASHSKLHPNRRISFFSNINILKKPDQLIAYPIFRHKKHYHYMCQLSRSLLLYEFEYMVTHQTWTCIIELRLLYIFRDSRLYPFGVVVIEIVLRKRVLDHNMHVGIVTKVCMAYKLFLIC